MKLKFISKKNETGNVKTFYFQPPSLTPWKAGQYLIYSLPHNNEDLRGRMRFFTISAAPYEELPTITTKIEEKPSSFKKALDNLEIGQIIEAKGPDGDFITENPDKNYVFLAGGIGITPFISIIKDLNHRNQPINATLIYSNKTEEILFRKELTEISKTHKELKAYYLISPQHIDENIIRKLVPDIAKPTFYISGPEPMVATLEKTLKLMGIREENIKQDYFPGYETI